MPRLTISSVAGINEGVILLTLSPVRHGKAKAVVKDLEVQAKGEQRTSGQFQIKKTDAHTEFASPTLGAFALLRPAPERTRRAPLTPSATPSPRILMLSTRSIVTCPPLILTLIQPIELIRSKWYCNEIHCAPFAIRE